MSFADELRGNSNDSGKSPSVSRLHEETISKIRKAQADFIKEFEKAVRQISIIKNNCNECSVSGYFYKFSTYMKFDYYYDIVDEKWRYSHSFAEKYHREPIAFIIDRVVITPVGARILSLPTPYYKDSVYFGDKECYPPKNLRLSDEMVTDFCLKIYKSLEELGFNNIIVRTETVYLNKVNTETSWNLFLTNDQSVQVPGNGKILYVSFSW